MSAKELQKYLLHFLFGHWPILFKTHVPGESYFTETIYKQCYVSILIKNTMVAEIPSWSIRKSKFQLIHLVEDHNSQGNENNYSEMTVLMYLAKDFLNEENKQ